MGVNVSTVMVVVALVAGLWWGFSRRRRRALLGVFSIAALALAVATLVIDGVLLAPAAFVPPRRRSRTKNPPQGVRLFAGLGARGRGPGVS